MIVDLHFVSVVDGHPRLARLDGNADIDAGVVVHVAHLVNDAEFAVADFSAGPVEKAHATAGFDEAVFDSVSAGADMLPAGEIFAVEELFPVAGLGMRGMDHGESGDGCCEEKCERRDGFAHDQLASFQKAQAETCATAKAKTGLPGPKSPVWL